MAPPDTQQTQIPSWLVVMVTAILLAGGTAWLTFISSRISDIEARLQARDARISAIEADAAARRAQLDAIQEGLHRLETKVDGIAEKVADLKITAASARR